MIRLALLYGLSGLIGLAYEVLWTRYLILQFGVSVWGVIITVAAFMLGLGLGSWLMLCKARFIKNPLHLLALLEVLIAIFAWFLPSLLHWVSPSLDRMASTLSPSAWHGLMGIAAFLMLTIPASAMGMSLPLILKPANKNLESLAYLYGANTLGAVFGALLPLLLLPIFGWGLTLRLIALLGMVLAVLYYLTKYQNSQTSPSTSERLPTKLLLSYGAMGAASLIVEVTWTRLFGLIMLRTEYVLAIILAIFLLGIGLGSLLAAKLSKEKWLNILPWLTAIFILLSLAGLPFVSAWVESAQWSSFNSAMWSQGLIIAALTLPSTLAFGAWFPLLARNSENNSRQGIYLYIANCLGAAAGTIITGTILIPLLGSASSLVLAAILVLLIGLSWSKKSRVWWFAPLVIISAIPLLELPTTNRLLPIAMGGSVDIYRYEDAIAITQVVQKPDGSRILLTDLQRQDASSEPTALFAQANQARLPLLLHPDPKSVLFLGLGTGISLAGSAPIANLQRTAVELSPGAISAARTWFAPFNQDILQSTTVIQDDARHFLNTTNNAYSVIIGDLFHPDLAGVGPLLSIEQFQRAKNHLNPDGLYVQWLALNQFDRHSMGVVIRSFHQVFPRSYLFIDGMHIALVGSNNAAPDAKPITEHLIQMADLQPHELTGGEGAYTWMGRYWGPLSNSVGPIQDEWSPVIDFSLPRLRYGNNQEFEWLLQDFLLHRPTVKEAERQLQIPAKDLEGFERAYIATDLMVRSWVASLRQQTPLANRLIGMAHEANPKDQWVRYAWSDR